MLLTILALLKHAGPLQVEVSVALRNTRTCQRNSLRKYSATVKAKGYSQVFNYLTIYVFDHAIKPALPIINARGRCNPGKESYCEKLSNQLLRSYCVSFTISLLGIYTHQQIKSHLTIILVSSDSDTVMCFHLAHAFQQRCQI